MRSSSGSSTGLPQSQTSSGVPTITGYDAYGRPITGPSGYTSQGFGPPDGRSPSERIKDAYAHGYPSSIESQQPGVINGISAPGSLNEQQPGAHTHNGRGPSNLGSSSFLNQPINSGKTPGSNIDSNGRAPSILAGRKHGQGSLDGSGRGGLDGSGRGGLDGNGRSGLDGSGRGGQPGSPSTYGSSHETGPTNGRSQSGRPSTSNLPSYSSTSNGGSPDGSPSSGRNQPIRSGTYDSSGYPDGRSPTNGGLPQTDSSKNVGSPIGKLPTDAYGQTVQTRPGSIGESENTGTGLPSTDVLAGLRNAFKLPPGLCLVRCDTLRTGQTSLTPEQIRDAFISSGLAGKGNGLIYIPRFEYFEYYT